ncbi:MAG: PaaI family thioesterase [Burkholderiales bacterium]|nr:PaaI family thioesterase [Burkholderiales bacterium]
MSPNQAIVLQMAESPGHALPFPADPLASALGARLMAVEPGRGEIRLDFEPGRTFLQGEGVVQGGAVSAMLDFATACAAMSVLRPGQDCATVTLTTSFLRPVPAGPCHVHAQVEKHGRTTVFARASLSEPGDGGRTLATAVAVLAVTSVPARAP